MRTTLIPSRPVRIAVASVVAALALAACGGGDEPTVASSGGASASAKGTSVPGIDATHNQADIAFITDMKPHHEGALEMAKLAEARAGSPKVKDLAARIVAAQDPEIQTMDKMATAWGVDLAAGGGPHGGGGMGMGGDTAALEPLSGAAFDKEFLTRMTAHHQSAVEMSQQELGDGQNAQAKKLAQDIITAQKKEIEEMKTLL